MISKFLKKPCKFWYKLLKRVFLCLNDSKESAKDTWWRRGGCAKLPVMTRWLPSAFDSEWRRGKRRIRKRRAGPGERGAGPGQSAGDKRRRRSASFGAFSPGAERRRRAAPLTDLKMSCFAFPLLSLFLQEATPRWAPKPWWAFKDLVLMSARCTRIRNGPTGKCGGVDRRSEEGLHMVKFRTFD